jgi:3,4-dihydroxyphenylacetate 2,3-dioxygenase
MSTAPPDIVRSALLELVVTDLDRARSFWVDLLGFHVSDEDHRSIWLRGLGESVHHCLVLTRGDEPACARLGFRVRTEADVDRAAEWYAERGCRVEILPAGEVRAQGRTARVQDPLGYTVDLFAHLDRAERLLMRWDLYRGAEIARIDHINLSVPDVQAAHDLYRDLGFGVSETIESPDHLYAAWMFRKQTVHDIAFTEGPGPRLHHIGFSVAESANVLRMADIIASRGEHWIERGPGRHGVSAAFYLYLRDPDKHRLEIYTTDYFTGDPDHETLRWSVDDPRRRDFWGGAVVPSWYQEAQPVLDPDGRRVPIVEPSEAGEVTVGADGLG